MCKEDVIYFRLFPNMVECVRNFGVKRRDLYLWSLIDYALYGKEPEQELFKNRTIFALFQQIKPMVEKARVRRKNADKESINSKQAEYLTQQTIGRTLYYENERERESKSKGESDQEKERKGGNTGGRERKNPPNKSYKSGDMVNEQTRTSLIMYYGWRAGDFAKIADGSYMIR